MQPITKARYLYINIIYIYTHTCSSYWLLVKFSFALIIELLFFAYSIAHCMQQTHKMNKPSLNSKAFTHQRIHNWQANVTHFETP